MDGHSHALAHDMRIFHSPYHQSFKASIVYVAATCGSSCQSPTIEAETSLLPLEAYLLRLEPSLLELEAYLLEVESYLPQLESYLPVME